MFLNQGNWQMEIALPPHHCAIGIMLASVITAAVPFMFSIGLGYLALSSAFQIDIVPRGDFRTGSFRLPLIPTFSPRRHPAICHTDLLLRTMWPCRHVDNRLSADGNHRSLQHPRSELRVRARRPRDLHSGGFPSGHVGQYVRQPFSPLFLIQFSPTAR